MEDSSFQSPVNQFNYSSPETPKKSKKFFYVILFLIFLVVAILGTQKFFLSKDDKETPVITPTPTEYQFPTDTPTPPPAGEPTIEVEKSTIEKKPTTTLAPTAKTVNPVDASTGLDRSTLTVEVQNGNGETGSASKGSDVLKSFGYKVIATGNADNFDYQNATVKVKSTKVNFLALLKKDLGFSYTVGSASADLSSSSTADALVIIGK